MDYQEIDEAELEKQKKAKIEYRTKKNRSTIFMILASLFEIVETLLLMLGLFLLMSLILFKSFDPQSATVRVLFEVFSVLIFIGSMVGGFLIYKAVVSLVIRKFNLQDKLLDDVLQHYVKQSKEDEEKKLKR